MITDINILNALEYFEKYFSFLSSIGDLHQIPLKLTFTTSSSSKSVCPHSTAYEISLFSPEFKESNTPYKH